MRGDGDCPVSWIGYWSPPHRSRIFHARWRAWRNSRSGTWAANGSREKSDLAISLSRVREHRTRFALNHRPVSNWKTYRFTLLLSLSSPCWNRGIREKRIALKWRISLGATRFFGRFVLHARNFSPRERRANLCELQRSPT
jgi:hypothetical protein